jgi:hypothetical protein
MKNGRTVEPGRFLVSAIKYGRHAELAKRFLITSYLT